MPTKGVDCAVLSECFFELEQDIDITSKMTKATNFIYPRLKIQNFPEKRIPKVLG
jgi:hypothetical protein